MPTPPPVVRPVRAPLLNGIGELPPVMPTQGIWIKSNEYTLLQTAARHVSHDMPPIQQAMKQPFISTEKMAAQAPTQTHVQAAKTFPWEKLPDEVKLLCLSYLPNVFLEKLSFLDKFTRTLINGILNQRAKRPPQQVAARIRAEESFPALCINIRFPSFRKPCTSPNNLYIWGITGGTIPSRMTLGQPHFNRWMPLRDGLGNYLNYVLGRNTDDRHVADPLRACSFFEQAFSPNSRYFYMFSAHRCLIWSLPNHAKPKLLHDLRLLTDTEPLSHDRACLWATAGDFLIGHGPWGVTTVDLSTEKISIKETPKKKLSFEVPFFVAAEKGILRFFTKQIRAKNPYRLHEVTVNQADAWDLPGPVDITGKNYFTITSGGNNVLSLNQESQVITAWRREGNTMKKHTPPEVESGSFRLLNNSGSPYVSVTNKNESTQFFNYTQQTWSRVDEKLHGYTPYDSGLFNIDNDTWPNFRNQNPHVVWAAHCMVPVPCWVDDTRAVPLLQLLGETTPDIDACSFSADDTDVAVAESENVVFWDLLADKPKQTDKKLPPVPDMLTDFKLTREADTLIAWSWDYVALWVQDTKQWNVLKLPETQTRQILQKPTLSKNKEALTFVADDKAYMMLTEASDDANLPPPAVALHNDRILRSEQVATSSFTPDGCFVCVDYFKRVPQGSTLRQPNHLRPNITHFGRLYDLRDR